ncbi:MAG: ECF transporter S component [Treponema sp.]|nr:ECF transporter S component [Treponema sp.]
MNNVVKKIAVAGVLSSVVIVLGITGLGFILLPFGAAITILQVPVIIGAILEGPLVGLFIGLLFGIFSIIQSSIIAASPVDMAFVTYPFIALIPRILIGPTAWFLYTLISGQLWNKKESQPSGMVTSIAVIIAAIIGSLVNTVLVLGGLGLLQIFPWEVIFPIAVLNGPVEAVVSSIITFIVISLWKNLHIGRGRSKLSKEK